MVDKLDSEENILEAKKHIDGEFQQLVDFIKDRNFSQLKKAVEQNLRYLNKINNSLYNITVNYYNKYKLWGTYYPENDDYELTDNRALAFSEHIKDFEWLYKRLKDYRSKRILVNILYYWLMSDSKRIEQIHDKTFNQYFDLDIVECDKNEVFVDIGAYIGDTLVDYSKVYGKDCYKSIYCYEIVPANIGYIKENIKKFNLSNVNIKEKGVSNRNDTMYLSSNALSSVSQLTKSGEIAVPIVKLDEDINEDVTFIKMDIEGAEEEALLGCVEKIKKSHPKLALSVYHNHKDIWKLARIIYNIDDSYNFYLRYYGTEILPTEYILYAI